jgi:hypothetical protein
MKDSSFPSAAELTADRSSFDNGVQTAWDATSLDLAQTCLRKYYYANILGIKPKHKSVHLLFGGIYASALEEFYKLRAKGSSIDEALAEVVLLALRDSWDHERGCALVFDDANKTRVALIRTIVWYVDQFADESEHGIRTYHLQNGEPAVELSFQVDFATDIIYCGHLDRVVEYGDDLYVMDQKTTKTTVGTYYFRQFDINNQMSGYSFAGQIVLHSPVRGVIIDAAQILASSVRFERGITTRSKDQLDEWLHSTIEFLEMVQNLSEREFFPMNPNSCFNYGGCPYKQLCSVSPKLRKNYIKSDFESHRWDPLVPR